MRPTADTAVASIVELIQRRVNRPFFVCSELVELGVVDERAQRVAKLPELLAVGADVLEDLFLEIRIGRLAEVDVDEAELTADHAQHECPRIDDLIDVAGQRHGQDARLACLSASAKHAGKRPHPGKGLRGRGRRRHKGELRHDPSFRSFQQNAVFTA